MYRMFLFQVAFTSSSSIQVASTWCLKQIEVPATTSWMSNAFPNQINSCCVLIFILAYYGYSLFWQLCHVILIIIKKNVSHGLCLNSYYSLGLFNRSVILSYCFKMWGFWNYILSYDAHSEEPCSLHNQTQATFQEILINFPPNKTLELCQGSHQVLWVFVFLLIATYSWETKTMMNLR